MNEPSHQPQPQAQDDSNAASIGRLLSSAALRKLAMCPGHWPSMVHEGI